MKKSLLALAMLGAFAGAASAQTNVTIYGIVDAAIEWNNPSGANNTTWSMTDGNSNFNKNGSRLGFKGSEDLGGGLSAIFQLENGFNVDSGVQAGALFGRQAFVGLKGNFGTVKLGRQYNPMFGALDTIDPFNVGFTGDMSRVFNPNGARTNNTINYSYSNAGLSAEVAYALGEAPGNFGAGRQWGLGLGYANGPLNVQFAYTNDHGTVATPAETKTLLVGGVYDLGVAKVHAGFQTDKNDVAGGNNDRNWMLGVSAPVGAGQVLASYVRGDDRTATNADVDQLGVGYVHNLSKRTNVYTSFAHQNDKSAANLDNNVFNVGVQHRF